MQENAGDFLAWNHPIGSIYHLYIANWVIICYHPPIKGNQETPLKKKNNNLKGTTMRQICKSAS